MMPHKPGQNLNKIQPEPSRPPARPVHQGLSWSEQAVAWAQIRTLEQRDSRREGRVFRTGCGVNAD